jgi:phage tail sheath protein FI
MVKDQVFESFFNVSLDPLSTRYVGAVLAEGSSIIQIDPDTFDATKKIDAAATKALEGGLNGAVLTPEAPAFTTALTAAGTGYLALAKVDQFNLLNVPGYTSKATLEALQAFCHEHRAMLLVDPEIGDGTALDPIDTAPDLSGADSINSAFYYPWLLAPDPQQQSRIRPFPPCGAVAGVYARTDATRGVWKAPAGTDASLTGVLGTAVTLNDAQNGILNPQGVNVIRKFPVYGTIVWGARTLRGADEVGSEWKYVPVRRTALFIEESLFRGLKWVVFEPNDEPLWASIRLNVGSFLNDLFRQGAFQGSTPKDAYFVKCDKDTTTQSDINKGIVNILVGFAPLKPAEFVVIKLQQLAGQLAT